jgi:hypothetical protein
VENSRIHAAMGVGYYTTPTIPPLFSRTTPDQVSIGQMVGTLSSDTPLQLAEAITRGKA